MNVRNMLIGAALVVGTAVITAQVISQEKKGGAQPPMTPEMQKMQEQWKAAGAPGENHKLLGHRVGKWNGTGKFWMMPDTPAEESTFTAEVKSLFDGRYVSETVEGTCPGTGETFLGQAWCGYDNVTKKFFTVWIDNMGTGKMDAEGTYDAASKTFKYNTEASCPITQKVQKGRTVEKWTDNDHFVVEMYGPAMDTGKEYKTMELTYARAK